MTHRRALRSHIPLQLGKGVLTKDSRCDIGRTQIREAKRNAAVQLRAELDTQLAPIRRVIQRWGAGCAVPH